MRVLTIAAGLLAAVGLFGMRPAAAAHEGMACCKAGMSCSMDMKSKGGCCLYVACCEVGNRGFFTKTRCAMCAAHSGHPMAEGSCCCSGGKGMGMGMSGMGMSGMGKGMGGMGMGMGMHSDAHPGHGGHAKMDCCLYVPCHEVGNRGFFTATKMAGCCSMMGKCDMGACCAGGEKGSEAPKPSGEHDHH